MRAELPLLFHTLITVIQIQYTIQLDLRMRIIMYYLAPKISRQDQVVEKKEARMARRGSPEIFSDQGSPVLPVQSAKSFYGTGRKSKNLKAMLGAFYKSNPFINCAAQIINS